MGSIPVISGVRIDTASQPPPSSLTNELFPKGRNKNKIRKHPKKNNPGADAFVYLPGKTVANTSSLLNKNNDTSCIGINKIAAIAQDCPKSEENGGFLFSELNQNR